MSWLFFNGPWPNIVVGKNVNNSFWIKLNGLPIIPANKLKSTNASNIVMKLKKLLFEEFYSLYADWFEVSKIASIK